MFARYLFSTDDIEEILLEIYNYEAKTHVFVKLIDAGNRILAEKENSILGRIRSREIIDQSYIKSFVEKIRANPDLDEKTRHALTAHIYAALGREKEAIDEYFLAEDVCAAIGLSMRTGKPEYIQDRLETVDHFIIAARKAYEHDHLKVARKFYHQALDALLSRPANNNQTQQDLREIKDVIDDVKNKLGDSLKMYSDDKKGWKMASPQLREAQNALIQLMPMVEGRDVDIWRGLDVAKEAFRRVPTREFGEMVLQYASYVMEQLRTTKAPRYALLTARTAVRLIQKKEDNYYQFALKNYHETADYFAQRGNHRAAGRLREHMAEIFSLESTYDRAIEEYLRGRHYRDAAALEWKRGRLENACRILDRPGYRHFAVDYLLMERVPDISRILFMLEKDGQFEKASAVARSYPDYRERLKIYEKLLSMIGIDK